MEANTSKSVNTGKMHDLPVEKALLYWIPSILVAIGMFITLLCSFWKFHKRKMFIRQLQLDYMEVNLEVKRPRIGAIRCNTHGAKWDDLMASLSLNNNFPASFRQLGHIKSLKQYDTLYEQSEEGKSSKLYGHVNKTMAVVHSDLDKEVNAYYEQRGYVDSDTRVKKDKKKKKKRTKTHLHGGSQVHKNDVELNSTVPSPRSLPVIENHLWKGYSEKNQSSAELQGSSFHFSRSYLHHYDSNISTPRREKKEFSNNFQETVQRNIRRDRPQEERVFWVLATDIQQSAV